MFRIVVVMLILLPLVAWCSDVLDIHGKEVALGMERSLVLSRLRDYRLTCFPAGTPIGECNSILVQSSDRPPYDTHANVAFQSGRVTSIYKYWDKGFEGAAPGKFVQTLYALLSQARQQGDSIEVTVGERRDPGVLQQRIAFLNGRKTIVISYGEGFRNPDGSTIALFVTLHEVLE